MNLVEANDINHNNRLSLIGKGNLASDYYNENRRQFEAYGQTEQGYFIVYASPDFTGWQDKHLRIKLEVLTEKELKEYKIEYNPFGFKYEKWYLNRNVCIDFWQVILDLNIDPLNSIRDLVKETFRKSYGFSEYGEKIFEE